MVLHSQRAWGTQELAQKRGPKRGPGSGVGRTVLESGPDHFGEPPRIAQRAERGVPSPNQLPGSVDDSLQDRIQLQFPADLRDCVQEFLGPAGHPGSLPKSLLDPVQMFVGQLRNRRHRLKAG